MHLRRNFCHLQLPEKLIHGVVGESEIGGCEILIKDRSAKKIGQLLFFERVAWSGQNVPPAGENRAGNLAVERTKEGQKAVVEEQLSIAAAELDAVGGLYFVGCRRIDFQMIQLVHTFTRIPTPILF